MLYTALAGVLLFFGLTRTQVGRDGLRAQIERSFAREFQGRLEIGALKGNLIQDLFASDVRLLDTEGNTVLVVDSVVVRPHWRDLFRRQVSLGSLDLIRPEFGLIGDRDGRWNFQKALAPRRPGAPGKRSPWSFTSARLRIRDGRIWTKNLGPLPAPVARRTVFDYTNTRFSSLDAELSLDLRSGAQHVIVNSLDVLAPEVALAVEKLSGQVVARNGRLAFRNMVVRTGATDARFAGWIEPKGQQTRLELDVLKSTVSFTELRRLFPTLPADDAAGITMRVRGNLADLKLDHLAFDRGITRITGRGRITGLQSDPAFNLVLDESTIDGYDLEALLPGVDFSRLKRLGVVSGTADGKGSWTGAGLATGPFRVEGEMDLKSDAGTIRGTAGVLRGTGRKNQFKGDLQVSGADLARILDDPSLASNLTGKITFNGTGTGRGDIAGIAQVDMAASAIAGHVLDSFFADVSATGGHVQAIARIVRDRGLVDADATIRLDSIPSYEVALIANQLDLGSFLGSDSLETSLNGHLTLDGAGRTWRDFRGTIEAVFDPGTVRWGRQQRQIIPHRNVLSVSSPAGSGQRITIGGDIADLELEGDAPASAMALLTGFWSQQVGDAFRQEFSKPYHGLPAVPASDTLTLPTPALTATYAPGDRIRALLHRAGSDSTARIEVSLKLKRPEILTALVPTLPPIATDLSARLSVIASPTDLNLRGDVTADSLIIGKFRLDGVESAVTAEANLRAPIRETARLSLNARADTAQVANQAFRVPHLVLNHRESVSQMAFSTEPYSRTGTASMSAEMRFLPDRNRLHLQGLQLDVGGVVWNNPREYTIDIYQDVAVIPELAVESEGDRGRPQRIELSGRLSGIPGDTLQIGADRISLNRLSRLLALKKTIGGEATARLALAGGLLSPELTGGIEVASLSFDNRLLGQLSINSRYVQGSTDVGLRAVLEPMPTDIPPPIAEGDRPILIEENHILAAGTFRLPQRNSDGREISPGALDLDLEATRADLFFFEYIFGEDLKNVQGYADGSGHVGGTLHKPLFEADLNVRGGHFEIPRFNLVYEADGKVNVDRRGIHITEGTLRDLTGGTGQVRGSVLFNDYRYFSLDLSARVEEIQIIDVMNSRDLAFYGRIKASGDLTLTGPIYNTVLRSANATTTPDSEIFIPITETGSSVDPGFIVFADSTGKIPDIERYVRRTNVLAQRPAGERPFLDGLDMDLSISAPAGSTIHLVIDPLLGDEMNAVGSGRIQLQRREGEYFTYGSLDVTSGDYLFTAGDVFFRRFLVDEGRISWDGDPTDAELDVYASYRTRASRAGLENYETTSSGLIPLNVGLHVTGRVSAPAVDLNLTIDRSSRDFGSSVYDQALEAVLREPEHSAEYATSVLLTNSFLLTTASLTAGTGDEGTRGASGLTDTRNQFAFNSVSQLVASQVNRYINQAVPNLDLNFGVQGDRAQDLDVTYGVALRLLDERLIIRGQGVYENEEAGRTRGEFVVEVKLSPAVSVEVFYRREGDAISDQALMNTTGAGLSYQTQFINWHSLFRKVFGWAMPRKEPDEQPTGVAEDRG